MSGETGSTIDRDALDTAGRLLARRAHTRGELRRKLLQRDYPRSVVERTLDRAEELGWIDDEQAGRYYVDEQIRRGGHGRRWVKAKLLEKGVEREPAERILEETWSDQRELELAGKSLEKWLQAEPPGSDPAGLYRRGMQRCLRRGFDPDIAARAIEEKIGRNRESENGFS